MCNTSGDSSNKRRDSEPLRARKSAKLYHTHVAMSATQVFLSLCLLLTSLLARLGSAMNVAGEYSLLLHGAHLQLQTTCQAVRDDYSMM